MADFGDKSGQGHQITNSGVVLTGGQSVFQGGSAYFNGSSYISIADSDDWHFGSDDFTIDLWVQFVSTSTTQYFIQHLEDGNNQFRFFYEQSVGELRFHVYEGSVQEISLEVSWSVGTSTWYHIAVVRNGTSWRLFIDGIVVASQTSNYAVPDFSGLLYIGKQGAGSDEFYGYIDELRIGKGALWKSNFLVPARSTDGLSENDVLLLHCDGANASTNFPDASPSKHTVTAQADAKISTSQSKFSGSSVYLDGTGDYLSIPDSDDWDFSADDFTIDFWLYPTVSSWCALCAFNTDVHFGIGYNVGGTARNIGVFVSSNGVAWDLLLGDSGSYNGRGSISLTLDAWNHVALARDGNTWRTYINGVKDVDITVAGAILTRSEAFNFGRWGEGGPAYWLTGYLDEIRISKGVARWTSDFIPPIRTTPDPDFPVDVDDETNLLLHGEDITGTTDFYDHSPNSLLVTRTGDVVLSSAKAKFGGTSIYFPGSSDNLNVPSGQHFNFGMGDFTIDFWVNFSTIDGSPRTFFAGGGSNIQWLQFFHYDATNIRLTWGGPSASTEIYSWSPSTGIWYHVAVVRQDTFIGIFVDGSLIGSTTSYNPDFDCTDLSRIGWDTEEGRELHGYIDEFRVTKGLARFRDPGTVTKFTPPTTYYPEAQDSDTKLLLHMEPVDGNTYFLDSSPSGHEVFPQADVALSSAQKKFGSRSAYLDGTGDYLSIADSSDFDLGLSNEPFTVEVWFNTSLDAIWSILSRGANGPDDWNMTDGNQYLLQYISGQNRFYFYYNNNGSAGDVLAPIVSVIDNNWHHVAVIYDGTTTWVAVDGTLGAGVTTGGYYKPSASDTTRIGMDQVAAGGGDYAGYLDEIRISKGIAHWTAAFTPPTRAYPDYM